MQGQTTGFTFIDGNANCYYISGTQIIYKPVTKLQSSSGEYDGGYPKTVAIKKRTFSKLYKLAKNVITDEQVHEVYRNKGDGVIEFDKVSVNFKGRSLLYIQIHEMLLKIIN